MYTALTKLILNVLCHFVDYDLRHTMGVFGLDALSAHQHCLPFGLAYLRAQVKTMKSLNIGVMSSFSTHTRLNEMVVQHKH